MFACVCAAALSCGPCALSGFGPESPGALRLASVLVDTLPLPERTKGRILFQLVRPGMTKAQVRAAFSTCRTVVVLGNGPGGLWEEFSFIDYGLTANFRFPDTGAFRIEWKGTDGASLLKERPRP
jgi:hypothetical protein